MAVYEPLREMVEQAKREGKLLHCLYYHLYLTPDDLERMNDNGQLRWGPPNWELVSSSEMPDLRLERLEMSERLRQFEIENRIRHRAPSYGWYTEYDR